MQSKVAIQKQLTDNWEIFPTNYYKMMKIGAQSNSLPILNSSTSSTVFEIPGGNCINLWKTRLSFLRNACGIVNVAATYAFLYTYYMALIQRIELYTSSNIR